MARALQKLCRNGNATSVSVPRAMLIHLGWLPGEMVIVELVEGGAVLIRRPVPNEFAPVSAPRLLFDSSEAVRS